MAVRLDIRPRIVLRDEPRPTARRRRFRLPPLALPAAGYWAAMAALTYVFAHLGAHPLENVTEAPPQEPAELSAPNANVPANANASLPEAPPEPTPTPEPTTEPEPAPSTPTVAEDPAPTLDRNRYREDNEPSPRAEPAARVALSFPEFSDSSRPAPRERAADGPRIDSLFQRSEQRSASDAPPAPRAPETDREASSVAMSCEAAVARNNEQLEIGGPRGPADVSREAYAGILQNGRYLTDCSLPTRTVFEICAAVRDGRAVGITVVSSPTNPSLDACVRRAVSRLKFPANARLDVTHTRFDALGR